MKNIFFVVILFRLAITQAQTALPEKTDSTLMVFDKNLYIQSAPAGRFSGMNITKNIVAPIVLGGASYYSAKTHYERLNKFEIREERNEHLSSFRTRVDDYIQYAPIGAVYGLDLLGVKAKHNLVDRTVLLVKSELLVLAITYPLKRIVGYPRPDTGAPTSFPSGHAAQAFAVATVVAKEYGHRSVWYSVGAYSTATSVAVLRVLNNRHWSSDVLAGAAIGILSTNIAYMTHRYKWKKKKNKMIEQTMIAPSYDGRNAMVSIVAVIK